jgi:hypothetical protein
MASLTWSILTGNTDFLQFRCLKIRVHHHNIIISLITSLIKTMPLPLSYES